MMKSSRLLILTCLILASVSALALSPTQIQQILTIPNYNNLMAKLWHIGDDIVGFYGLAKNDMIDKDKPEGYLRISPKTSEVKRILDDTIASCHKNISFLDRSYYYAAASTLLYYCVSNNSLLLIETKDYTVQEVIPVSTSQTFAEVILGHNEEGQVYIIGLPEIIYEPATTASELILVNLTTKAVENHVVFNKGSDSQLLVTGYAFDSGISYILTKGLRGDQTLIEISKLALRENDYELTPFVNFTYGEKSRYSSVSHNPLDIIGGYFFTNDDRNLLVFDKSGSLFQNKTNLERRYYQRKVYSLPSVAIPVTGAQIGGSTFYVQLGFEAYGYSLKDGVMISSKIGNVTDELKMAFGDRSELLVSFDLYIFSIIEMATNTTLYTSLRYGFTDLMVSSSYYFGRCFDRLYVFDRKTPGKLLQKLALPRFSKHDKVTNLILGLSEVSTGCQISYMDLETLAVHQGPLIKDKNACSLNVVHIDITNTAKPFFIIDDTKTYLFVSPATYGTVSWSNPVERWADGTMMPEEGGESFSFVIANKGASDKKVQIYNYKLNKLIKRFILQDTNDLATIPTDGSPFKMFWIVNNKIIMTHNKTKLTTLDLALKNTVSYDVPAFYQSHVKVFYDKNKIPYVTLTKNVAFGEVSPLPQLFNLTNIMPVPGAISNLTRFAYVTGPCGYYVVDVDHENIGVIRFYDSCSSTQTNKIHI